jgi:putative PIN family toxin of toxin-antitoxin system
MDCKHPMAGPAPPSRQEGTGVRVVFDTNVLLSLWVFEDSRFAPLRALVDRGEWVALTDEHCLAEFSRVLGYDQFGLSAETQAGILADYRASAEIMLKQKSFAEPLPRCSDRDDQKFLELARNAGAGWLITADKALLKMARRCRLAGLFDIITPDAALAGKDVRAA